MISYLVRNLDGCKQTVQENLSFGFYNQSCILWKMLENYTTNEIEISWSSNINFFFIDYVRLVSSDVQLSNFHQYFRIFFFFRSVGKFPRECPWKCMLCKCACTHTHTHTHRVIPFYFLPPVGHYQTFEVESLQEFDQAQLCKVWNPGRALCQRIQRRWAVPQAHTKGVHVLTNEAVFKSELIFKALWNPLIVQWNLFLMRTLGPWKLLWLNQVSRYIRV